MFFFYSNEQMCEAYRNAIRSASGLMNASLGGMQRLQSCQLSAMQEILSAHAEAAERLDEATSVDELVGIAAQLGWMQFDKFLSCWGGVHANIGRNQMELMRQAQSTSMQAMDGVDRMLDGMPVAPGTEPVVHALRVVVDTTRSSCAAGMRAIEEAEREVVERMESASEELSGKEQQAEQGDEQQGGQERAAA